MSFPSYLEYFSSSIDNVSTARFKVQPTSNSDVQAHQSIQFNLPQNALLDFRKMRVVFQVTTTGTYARLPTMASSYFNRISFEVGGQQISAFENANLLDHILRDNLQIESDPVNEKAILSRKNNPVTLLAADNETYADDDNKAYFSIDLGTLARSIQPSIVAMQYLSQVSVTLHLAENAVCASPSNVDTAANFLAQGTQTVYTIKNAAMMVDVYDIMGSDLMQIYQQTIQDQGYLELTYSNWSSFSDTFNTVTRASSSAMSVKKLVAAFRRNSDDNRPLPHAYNAVNGAIGFVGYNNDLLASAANVGTQASPVLGGPATQGTEYESAFFTMTAPVLNANAEANTALTKAGDVDPQLNFTINSVKYPSYNCPIHQWYDITKSGWNVRRTKSNSLAEWVTNRFSICQRLDLPDSSALRLMSGLNLKASNANISLEITGGSTSATTVDNVVLFIEADAILRAGAGRQIQILH